MMRRYEATRFQRFVSDIRYTRFLIPDIVAGLVTVIGFILLPIIAALMIG